MSTNKYHYKLDGTHKQEIVEFFNKMNAAIDEAFEKARRGKKQLTRSAIAGFWLFVKDGELIEIEKITRADDASFTGYVMREAHGKWYSDAYETLADVRRDLQIK